MSWAAEKPVVYLDGICSVSHVHTIPQSAGSKPSQSRDKSRAIQQYVCVCVCVCSRARARVRATCHMPPCLSQWACLVLLIQLSQSESLAQATEVLVALSGCTAALCIGEHTHRRTTCRDSTNHKLGTTAPAHTFKSLYTRTAVLSSLSSAAQTGRRPYENKTTCTHGTAASRWHCGAKQ